MPVNLRHLLLTGLVLIVACTVTPEPTDEASVAASETRTANSTETLPANQSILFWTPAETQVGFRSIDKVMPQLVRTVKRGNTVRALPSAPGQALDVHFEHEGVSYTTDSYMEKNRVSGIIVVKNGKVLLERYGLGRKPEDRWISFSVTKSLTSTLIGAAIKDGLIRNIDDTVDEYITEMQGSVYADVSIRQLLTMSSGATWNEDYTDPESDVARLGRVMFDGEPSPILGYMRRLERAQPAGEVFNYSTGETDLAGYVLSRAVGMSMSDYLSKKIWAAYGMEQDAIWLTDSSGHERGGCCLNMTLRDYARIGQFMLEDGAGVTPAGWVQEASRKHLPVNPDDPNRGYGYFWWTSGNTYAAIGIFGQMIHIEPEHGVVIAINSAWPVATGAAYSRSRSAFVSAAVRAASTR
jgi:CubicO group peptidase (beta-lactamase class C family)